MPVPDAVIAPLSALSASLKLYGEVLFREGDQIVIAEGAVANTRGVFNPAKRC